MSKYKVGKSIIGGLGAGVVGIVAAGLMGPLALVSLPFVVAGYKRVNDYEKEDQDLENNQGGNKMNGNYPILYNLPYGYGISSESPETAISRARADLGVKVIENTALIMSHTQNTSDLMDLARASFSGSERKISIKTKTSKTIFGNYKFTGKIR